VIDMFELEKVIIDAANLMFLAQLRHAKVCFTGDFGPACNEFQYLLRQAMGQFKQAKLIFDGQRWEPKVHENFRR
jgi:hypothetical protein